ncbi:hypothetical protein F7725_011180 [Dissostichus mawsoni]|uniref:Uncharacterized protein n=1 Tax=Dissostichus mawsoni TaxID=36200 RepID=A0A7J5ZAA6_DISMA|nr:hypothetical protein F7725_011180 [Dissostichus mawsoni]
MRPGQLILPAAAALLFLLAGLSPTSGCNKALCASDVSKCLIQELCQCRPSDGNCSCCKECMLCLGNLWEECCDCVGMCNPKNYSDTPATSKSTVEELHRPIPSLFRALTEGEAPINMMVVSFPVAEELSHHEKHGLLPRVARPAPERLCSRQQHPRQLRLSRKHVHGGLL